MPQTATETEVSRVVIIKRVNLVLLTLQIIDDSDEEDGEGDE